MSDAKTDLSLVSQDELLRELRRRAETRGAPELSAALARLDRLEALVEGLCDSMAGAVAAQAKAHARPAPSSRVDVRGGVERVPIRLGSARRGAAPSDVELGRSPGGGDYPYPPLSLLDDSEQSPAEHLAEEARSRAIELVGALRDRGVHGQIVGIACGPVDTTFHVQVEARTRLKRLEAMANDIALALAAPSVRIIAGMKGSTAICIEVPNKSSEKVRFKDILSSGQAVGMELPMFLGKDSAGDPLVLDLARMPHMLITGTTGSGKSVCMNTIIMSFLYTKRPDELKLVLVDPKMVEMAMFAGIPHLACPVVTDMGKAARILEWAVTKMEERYELLMRARVRDIKSFNAMGDDELRAQMGVTDDREWARVMKKMPYMVFAIDGFADLMMTNREVEDLVVRIAQRGRPVGLHLLLATHRPQSPVVTGQMRSSIPSRIAFKAASGADSRLTLDRKGAECLAGNGDMLVLTPARMDVSRCHGVLVEEREADGVLRFLKERIPAPNFERQLISSWTPSRGEEDGSDSEGGAANAHKQDELFDKAVEFIIESGRGSVSLLQRRFALGYGRASRLVDLMGQAGLLGEHKGSQGREVIVSVAEWQRMKQDRGNAATPSEWVEARPRTE